MRFVLNDYMNGNRVVFIDFLHLFALVGFAVAQPLYDLLGQNPEFFVSHKASPMLIVGMVVVLSIGVALGLVLLEFVAWLIGERVRCSMHWVFVFSLVTLTVLPPAQRMADGPDLVIVGTALLIGFLFTVLYVRRQAVRLFVTALSPVIVAFPLWFLLFTPVGRLVMPDVLGAQADIEIKNPVPVVLVVLDEFNITALLDAEGRIDPIRFPNFAALASESWWFPNAVATYVETTVAVSAILTGRQPRSDVALNPTATDHPQNLFTMLGDQYRLNVFESATTLCPHELCKEMNDTVGSFFRCTSFFADVAVIYLHIILTPQLRQALPSLNAQWRGFGGALIGDVAFSNEDNGTHLHLPAVGENSRDMHLASFLSQIKKSPNPGLYFLHVILPHAKYEYLVSGHYYYSSFRRHLPVGWNDGPGWGGRWIGKEPLILTAYYRYLQQIGYLDRFLGKLRISLKTAQLYDNALIILTADHGVSFQRGLSMREVQKGNERDILKVPMFIKLPGQREGRINERLVSGIDVVPTIADVLGVKMPWEIDGVSMFDHEIPPRGEINVIGLGTIKARDLKGFPRLKWQVDHFGEHTALDRLVPKGPYPELIRQAVSDLRVGQYSGLRFYSENLDYLEQVDIESGFLPALFRAYIVEEDGRNLPIAIALNGRIWATTITSEWEGNQNYFSVLLPPAAFKEGRNVIGVYLIEEPSGMLLPIALNDEHPTVRFHYDYRSGRMKLVFSDSREILINLDRGLMQGNLDSVTLDGKMLVFSGWGADISENRPAKEVLIFAGEQLVSRVEPGSSRQDVADGYQQQALLYSGFNASVPVGVLKSRANEIRVIILSEGDRNLGLSFSDEQKAVVRAALEKEVFNQ